MVNGEGLAAIQLQQATSPLRQRYKVQRHHFIQTRRPGRPLLSRCLRSTGHSCLCASTQAFHEKPASTHPTKLPSSFQMQEC